jgi:putative membrane protein
MAIIISLVLSMLAVGVTSYLLPGVEVVDWQSLLMAAVLLGIANAILRPILLVLTLPINFMTLGLFTFVINAVLVLLVAEVVPGFAVDGFGWALIFSIVLSIVNMGLSAFKE